MSEYKIYWKFFFIIFFIIFVSPKKIIPQDTYAQWKLIDTGFGTVYWCAAEDSSGNIWFGTEYGWGPVVYNGKEFIQYDYPLDKTWAMITDSTGTLWIGTIGGIYTFNGNKFEQVVSEYINECEYVTSLCLDNDGSIWVGTTDGLRHFKDDQWIIYEGEQPWEGLSDKEVYALFTDSKGNKWISVNSYQVGYSLVKYDNKNWRVFTKEEGNLTSRKAFPHNFIEDSSGNIWMRCGGFGGGIYMYNGTIISRVNTDPNFPPYWSASDRKNYLWFVKYGILLNRNGEWIRFTAANTDFVPDNIMTFVFVDSKDNKWFFERGRSGKVLFLSSGEVLSPEEVFEMVKTEVVTKAGNIILSPNPITSQATI